MRNYKILSSVAGGICLTLAAIWMFVPDILLGLWGIGYSASAGIVARRMSGLFLALGYLLFKTRHSPPSPERAALASAFALGCSVLAALGLFELVSGRAGVGILSAVLVEIALAAAFIKLGRSVAG